MDLILNILRFVFENRNILHSIPLDQHISQNLNFKTIPCQLTNYIWQYQISYAAFQVQALNNAGAGESTDVLRVSTEESGQYDFMISIFTFKYFYLCKIRVRLLLWTPGIVPFGTCKCSNVETIWSWTCHVYGSFRTSLGTYILLHNTQWKHAT